MPFAWPRRSRCRSRPTTRSSRPPGPSRPAAPARRPCPTRAASGTCRRPGPCRPGTATRRRSRRAPDGFLLALGRVRGRGHQEEARQSSRNGSSAALHAHFNTSRGWKLRRTRLGVGRRSRRGRCGRARRPARARRPRASRAQRAQARRRARACRPAGYSPSSGTASVSPPERGRDRRQPRGHRLQRREREDLGVAARDDRDAPRAVCSARSSAGATWPTNARVPAASSSARCGPSPAITSGRLTARHASRTSANPFSGVSRPAASTNSPAAAVERVGELALDGAEHARLARPAARRASTQPLQRERARHDDLVRDAGEPPLLQREPGRVGGGLGARAAAAVEPHARAACCARGSACSPRRA